MKLVTSFALLVFSQINLILAAAEEQASAAPAKAENTPSDNINYNDVIPTVEKRFKAVMKLMKGEGFKTELLEKANAEINKVSTQFLSRFTPLLSEGARAASGQVVEPVPSWIRDSATNRVISHQAGAVQNALLQSGKSIHKLFVNLFENFSEQVQSAPVKPEAGKEAENLAQGNTGLTGSVATSETTVAENDQNDEDFLNLRFVMPPFAKDIAALYTLIKDKKQQTVEERNALVEEIKKWLTENVRSVKPKEHMVFETVREVLEKLCGSEKHLADTALSFDAYNHVDSKLAESIERCKNMNAASFGTMGLLLAAVIAFTMW
ncbi:hypothetical protein BBBOND_0206080 [Babesia bigemina]|uniref:Uncharacterized protein n=1 Tax=Babesia bigemina TaxID=5866 RepID=A0A061DCB4_BABBI|nr:hypothetical protein BBBOND_0206080 [Babesia bigemina]CDR95450.1 hypothetical protein BBBOND_0206080 [Babesia bigemina]|eukprot:XP_012767636.1 hypothetical protein BBBOND_0206080 [Babesia bigemina]